MLSATLELLSSIAQVRKGQVHEGLTALFNTSNYALAILSESNARIVDGVIFPLPERYEAITWNERFNTLLCGKNSIAEASQNLARYM